MITIGLAPMCGITDHLFRTLCFEQGCSLAYTEMVSAMGYLCAPDQKATVNLMKRGSAEKKLILQLFGREPSVVAEAAARISHLGIYDGIDINMGCPAKKIAPSGEGSGLMRTPEIAARMMKSTVKASCLPVSVKMRLGYDHEHINVLDFARMAEDAGVSMIAVHGRTREQQYSGSADWEMIAKVKASVQIPVLGNGDIFHADDAITLSVKSRVDGVLIGRGAMGNPWVFRSIRGMLKGEPEQPVSLQERHSMIVRHYRMMMADRPEPIAVREMRKHIGWYIKGLRDASRFRDEMNRIARAEEVLEKLDDYFDHINTQEEEGSR